MPIRIFTAFFVCLFLFYFIYLFFIKIKDNSVPDKNYSSYCDFTGHTFFLG